MKEIAKILVPYDFSPLSKKALGSALLLAKLVDAELHVVHVEVLHGLPLSESITAPAPAEKLKTRVEQDNAYIKDLYGDIVIFYAVGRGIAAGPIILDYLDSHKMDLVIIGTHGRQGLRRAFLGSVAEEIVRHSSCNVLTMTGDLDSFVQFDKLKHISVPVDFSEHSAQALRYAHDLATLSGSKLDLVHAVDFPSFATITDAAVFSIIDYDVDVEVKALEHLKKFSAHVIGDSTLTNYSILEGPPAFEIIQHAEENECDLIVIGTHGLTGFDRFLLGSVASKTIRRAPCPVLIVNSDVHKKADVNNVKTETAQKEKAAY